MKRCDRSVLGFLCIAMLVCPMTASVALDWTETKSFQQTPPEKWVSYGEDADWSHGGPGGPGSIVSAELTIVAYDVEVRSGGWVEKVGIEFNGQTLPGWLTVAGNNQVSTTTFDLDPAWVNRDPDTNSVVAFAISGLYGSSVDIWASTLEVVIDVMPPVVNSVSADPDTLWPPKHKMVEVTVSADCTDDVDPNPTCQIIAVYSNEPEDGLGDGDTDGDMVIVDADLSDGTGTVLLRAERGGGGGGRVYTIVVECTDACGNVSEPAQVEVTVPHDRRGE